MVPDRPPHLLWTSIRSTGNTRVALRHDKPQRLSHPASPHDRFFDHRRTITLPRHRIILPKRQETSNPHTTTLRSDTTLRTLPQTHSCRQLPRTIPPAQYSIHSLKAKESDIVGHRIRCILDLQTDRNILPTRLPSFVPYQKEEPTLYHLMANPIIHPTDHMDTIRNDTSGILQPHRPTIRTHRSRRRTRSICSKFDRPENLNPRPIHLLRSRRNNLGSLQTTMGCPSLPSRLLPRVHRPIPENIYRLSHPDPTLPLHPLQSTIVRGLRSSPEDRKSEGPQNYPVRHSDSGTHCIITLLGDYSITVRFSTSRPLLRWQPWFAEGNRELDIHLASQTKLSECRSLRSVHGTLERAKRFGCLSNR